MQKWGIIVVYNVKIRYFKRKLGIEAYLKELQTTLFAQ